MVAIPIHSVQLFQFLVHILAGRQCIWQLLHLGPPVHSCHKFLGYHQLNIDIEVSGIRGEEWIGDGCIALELVRNLTVDDKQIDLGDHWIKRALNSSRLNCCVTFCNEALKVPHFLERMWPNSSH